MKLYAQVFLKRINQNTYIFTDQIDENTVTQQSHVLVQPLAIVVVATPSTGVAGCARCS